MLLKIFWSYEDICQGKSEIKFDGESGRTSNKQGKTLEILCLEFGTHPMVIVHNLFQAVWVMFVSYFVVIRIRIMMKCYFTRKTSYLIFHCVTALYQELYATFCCVLSCRWVWHGEPQYCKVEKWLGPLLVGFQGSIVCNICENSVVVQPFENNLSFFYFLCTRIS